MKRRFAAGCILSGLATLSLASLAFSGPLAAAQNPAPERPRITGISHVGYFVSDLPKALDFWHGLLGYDEMYTLDKAGTVHLGGESSTAQVRIAFIKLNDRQHVELFTDPPPSPPNMMSHLCFAVSDIEQMRAYLKSKGIPVPAGNGAKTHTGDYAFEIHDPDGTLIEFVQSLPTGWEAEAKGKFLPPARISDGIYHVGFLVGNAEKSLRFYEDILGFKETWRGGRDPNVLSWINLRVPDGADYIELMLYARLPATYGTQNHTSLVVPDMAKAIADLQSRLAYKTYGKPLEMHVGVNGKRQVNLYDPDGTRVELMEPFTADGKPVPSSTAPPPPPAHE